MLLPTGFMYGFSLPIHRALVVSFLSRPSESEAHNHLRYQPHQPKFIYPPDDKYKSETLRKKHSFLPDQPSAK